MPKNKRLQRYQYGLWAEQLCRIILRLKGWRVVQSRCRTQLGEFDIVAVRGDVVALIEVKARKTIEGAAQSYSPAQQARQQRAVHVLLAQNPEWAHKNIRFDLMLVAPRQWPRHLQNIIVN